MTTMKKTRRCHGTTTITTITTVTPGLIGKVVAMEGVIVVVALLGDGSMRRWKDYEARRAMEGFESMRQWMMVVGKI